jgi:hypothetical protein
MTFILVLLQNFDNVLIGPYEEMYYFSLHLNSNYQEMAIFFS